MDTTCFPCLNPCAPTIPCPNCNPTLCNNCAESIELKCTFISQDLICTDINGTKGIVYIKMGTNAEDAITQLLCMIDTINKKLEYVMTTCCTPPACDIPMFKTITEV